MQGLNAALVTALADPALKQKIAALMWEARSSPPAELSRLVEVDYQRWGRLIRELGLKGQ